MRKFVVVALLLIVAAAELKRIGDPRSGNVPRNTLQACREDFRRICRKQEGGKSLQRHPIQCLTENVHKVEESTCKKWITAESACWDSAKLTVTDGRCDRRKSDIRRCFKNVQLSGLSDECKNSDFFTQLVARLDRRPRKNPTVPAQAIQA